ncbi:MAG: ribbon-helix-helix protein, CopG family [Anaerolineae bacterium]
MQAVVKTGVSLPKALFAEVEELARKMKMTRSRLFALALEDYVRRQRHAELLAQINAACGDGLDEEEKMLLEAAGEQLSRRAEGEW